MKKYIPTQTTDIEVLLDLNPYFIVIDGVQIGIEEDAGMAIQTLRSLVDNLGYLKPKFDIDKSWEMEAWSYCDYVEFAIFQFSWNKVQIISQFYDGTNKVTGVCDAKTFYQKMIAVTENYIQKLENNPDTITNFYRKIDFPQWKANLEKLKFFYQKYYESE